MKLSWFENPPTPSPSATPALGVGLCLNTMLLLAVYVVMERFAGHPSSLVQDAQENILFLYSSFVLACCFMYGLAGAAWTGWSWWRVPFATAAACVFSWCFNVLIVSMWGHSNAWPVQDPLLWTTPSRHTLILLGIGSFLVLLAVWSTLLCRRFSFSRPNQLPTG